ncbi:MAG: biotin-dependent carboxyltransferase family protein [Paracoccaceae bacterium]
MSHALRIHEAGPAVTLQDLGRSGTIAQGLTRGGAMDRLALFEGAALLDQPVTAAVEMVGYGGTFEATQDIRIALTGAKMQASLDGNPLTWNASHLLPAGAKLRLGGVTSGAVGYLHVGGGFDAPMVMGAMSAHLSAGLGTILQAGQTLALHSDTKTRTGWHLPPSDRLTGGTLHIVRSVQTDVFGADILARFLASAFTRDARANRQGIRLNPDRGGFAAAGGLSVVSEIIAPGDIQITGDGAPYVLMCESQTTGGYPRLGTVIPSDLPRIAQAPLGAAIQIKLVSYEDAITIEQRARAHIKTLPGLCRPLIRDPADMSDLLSYSLISGTINANADPFEGS